MKLILISCILLYAATNLAFAQRKVVCYWGTWAAYRQGNAKFEVDNIDPTICTHMIYTFLGANSGGGVTYLDSYLDLSDNWGKGYIDKFIALKSRSPGTKFLMSVGGWNLGSAVFSQIAASASTRSTFAQNVLNVLNKHGFDGFDFDWEYPAQRDSTYGSADKANFLALLREMKSKFSSSGKLLTIAVGATENSASASYDIPNVAATVDFINLMSYDLHGSWDSTTGINAPLYAGPNDVTSDQRQLNLDAIVKFWLRSGCPKEKLIVGIPLYGRSFTLSNSGNNGVGAPSSGAGSAGWIQEGGFLAYNEICYNLKNNGWTRYWQDAQKVPYAVKGNQWVGYDDSQSLGYKLNYIIDNGLGGAMFWSIETEDFNNICGQGKYPLVRATYNALIGNSPVTIPPTQGTQGTQPPTQGTTPRTTTSGGGGGSGCNGQSFYRDPNNCNAFYQCSGGVAYPMNCGAGLCFNTNGNYCDWCYNVSC